MAVSLDQLEDQLICSVCLDTYSNPKQLQCHHVFCQQCLVLLTVPNEQGNLSLPCPSCRQVTPLSDGGVESLQAAFQVNQLLEIVDKHRESSTAAFGSPKCCPSSPAPCQSILAYCSEHGEKEVSLYCETCSETICWKCIKKGERHHSHDYEELKEAFELYKGELMSFVEPMEKHLVTVEDALVQLEIRCKEIVSHEAAVKAEIDDSINRLHETLDKRKSELVDELNKVIQAKLKTLEAQRDQIETIQAQLSSCLLFMRESLDAIDLGDVLIKKQNTLKQMKELTILDSASLEPKSKADVLFSALADLTAECQHYGKVCTMVSSCPPECYLSSKIVDTVVGSKANVILQTLNPTVQLRADSISCQLVSQITGKTVEGKVKLKGDMEYEIEYTPTVKGRHLLSLQVLGQHIDGSPYLVNAGLPIRKIGMPILTLSGLKKPQGVAVNSRGEVVVTEWNGHCVTVLSPSGKRLRSFGMKGTEQGQFEFPYGVAVDDKDNILVADCNNHRIQKFTSQGEFVATVGTRGSGPLQFAFPHGIAVNPISGQVYVGSRNGRIQILNSDLSHYKTFGKRGSGKGQSEIPQHITCDNNGKAYVADFGNHRIQVFTSEGEFISTIGQHGESAGDLKEPWGVATDSSGRVYVSEQWNHRVSVFSSKGLLLKHFGGEGKGPGQFECPQGLAVDSSGVVYVCDFDNKQLQLF